MRVYKGEAEGGVGAGWEHRLAYKAHHAYGRTGANPLAEASIPCGALPSHALPRPARTARHRPSAGHPSASHLYPHCSAPPSAGTILTAELALEHGLACNTAGGEHCRWQLIEGYCAWFLPDRHLPVSMQACLFVRFDRALFLDRSLGLGANTCCP